jgi:hypothetical protein
MENAMLVKPIKGTLLAQIAWICVYFLGVNRLVWVMLAFREKGEKFASSSIWRDATTWSIMMHCALISVPAD